MHAHTNNLQVALSKHTIDGRYSLGTAAIVEVLHKDFEYSYEQLADIAKVSTAGLARWRHRDKGEHKTFAPLLQHAKKLLAGESGNTGGAPAAAATQADPARPDTSPVDVRQVMPLTIAEAKLGLSLKFGVDPAMIDIVIKG